MKVVSLLQPHATLVAIGAKLIDTRSWNTDYRGELLIHASKKMSTAQKQLTHSKPFWNKLKHLGELPLGKIIGKVDLYETVTTEFCKQMAAAKIKGVNWKDELVFGDYSAGRYGWLFKDPVSFTHHMEIDGALRLWNLNAQICLQCGCTECDPCIHPELGPCWWQEPYLCSHCAFKDQKDKLDVFKSALAKSGILKAELLKS